MNIRYWFIVFAASMFVSADTVVWDQDTGDTDWKTGSNWSSGMVPASTDIVELNNQNYATALDTNNSPVLSDTTSIEGLYINNYYNRHSYIMGDGTLILGGSGLDMTYYYLDIYPNIMLGTNQTWVLNRSSRSALIYLHGALGGEGGITLKAYPTDVRASSKLIYQGDPAATTFSGGITMYRDIDEQTYLGVQYELGVMSSPTSFSFGTGEIVGNNATFVAAATADSGGNTPGHIIQITNQLRVEEGGLVLISDQGSAAANMPNIQFSGDIDLGGVLSSGAGQYGAMAPVTGDITIRQSQAASPGLCGRQFDYVSRSSKVAGGISDGTGPFGNPLILRNHNESLYISGDAADMTYSGGTVIDQCGSDYNSYTKAACVNVDSGSKLGTGPVKILPGGVLLMNSKANVEGNISIKESDVACGTLALAFDDLPDFESSGGVLAIDGTFSTELDMSALGDGNMFLGTRSGGTYSGSSLAPGNDNLYRLGGGVQYKTLTIPNGVLTGSAGLQVGQAKHRGGGSVYLTGINDFTGDIDIIGLPGFWREPDITDHGSELKGKANAAGSPFGSSNSVVSLHCGRLHVTQGSASDTPAVIRKEQLIFEGRGRLYMDCSSYETHLTFGSIVRENRGILSLDTNQKNLGNKERVMIENPPLLTNGMLPPWFVAERDIMEADDQYFLTYDPTFGVDHFTNEVTDINAVTATDVFGGAGGTLTSDRTCYAVRTTSAVSGDYTLNITGGGLILDGSSADISCDIDFGSAEGIIFHNAIPEITGKISGNGGLTVSGVDGHVILRNTENDFTGDVYINGGTVYADFDTDEAHGSLGPTSNNIYINGGGLCQHKASGYTGSYLSSERTITLGTSGGYIAGASKTEPSILPVHSKITGTGMLIVDQENRSINSGMIVISNPQNDYTGGTLVPGDCNFPGPSLFSKYYGTLKATEEATLGTGDLQVGGYVGALLQGNTNVHSEANVHVAMNGFVHLEAPAPSFGSLSGAGHVRLGTTSTATDLTIGGTDKNSEFYGIIYETEGAPACSVTKVGTGSFTLYGAHRYTGPTTVENGTFSLRGSIAGDLVVDEGAELMCVVRSDGSSSLGHVGGDIYCNGTLVLNIPEGYDVPLGTTMTVLTCDGTLIGDIHTEDGYKVSSADGEIKLTRTAAGSVIIIQ